MPGGKEAAATAFVIRITRSTHLPAQLQPLRFIDRQLFPYLVKVTKQFAEHVDCDPRDLVWACVR